MKNTPVLLLTAALLVLSSGLVAGDTPGRHTRDTHRQSGADNEHKIVDEAVQGKSCVRDTKDMRRNHMKYLLHQRRETTRLGKRWPKNAHKNNFSLERCINCHARVKKGNEIVPVSIKDKNHFCNHCHRKVAVKIDCFQCHNSKPTGKINLSGSQTPAKSLKSSALSDAVEK